MPSAPLFSTCARGVVVKRLASQYEGFWFEPHWRQTLFDSFSSRCLVIGNTLQSIIESTADRKGLCKERVDKGHKPMVKWSKKTHTIEYVMDSVPLEKTAICEGKFQLILKENAKKE
ncbi:hypothetical protein B9Z55_000547 [Caenorhabditis nigoni]|uniref:Uncharacterized protein n=1 Tax=Caenorhabditis nigoni TaxID=1611254 RepID=A0A2G5VTP4_9PELO|nr:hypothetical protein B9Z55_000547 [Caenorhabditis nigoni]